MDALDDDAGGYGAEEADLEAALETELAELDKGEPDQDGMEGVEQAPGVEAPANEEDEDEDAGSEDLEAESSESEDEDLEEDENAENDGDDDVEMEDDTKQNGNNQSNPNIGSHDQQKSEVMVH